MSTVIERPPPQGRGYSAKIVIRAQRLYAAGWSIAAVQRHIEREFGMRPNWVTVKTWVNPQWAQERRTAVAKAMVGQRAADRRPLANVTPEWKLARMREMRAHGVGFRAIGIVAGLWWGEALVEDRVRYMIGGRR